MSNVVMLAVGGSSTAPSQAPPTELDSTDGQDLLPPRDSPSGLDEGPRSNTDQPSSVGTGADTTGIVDASSNSVVDTSTVCRDIESNEHQSISMAPICESCSADSAEGQVCTIASGTPSRNPLRQHTPRQATLPDGRVEPLLWIVLATHHAVWANLPSSFQLVPARSSRSSKIVKLEISRER